MKRRGRSRSWYEASEYYECPKCIEAYMNDEDLDSWGEFEVTARIDPGSEAVYYPNDKAHPGEPPSIDTIEHIKVVSGCPHSDDKEVRETLAEKFHLDFDDGKIDWDYQDEVDYYYE